MELRKILAVCLAVAMACSLTVIPAVAAEDSAKPVGRVDTVEVNGTDVYVYVPETIHVNNWSSPMIFVFGDEDYTAQTAEETALASGLAQIAAEENAVVTFLSSKGNEWGADDVETYKAAISDLYIERATNDLGGTLTDGKYEGKYMGYMYRIWAVGEGAGADFVSRYLITNDDSIYAFGAHAALKNLARYPASVILFNTAVAPTATEDYVEFPAVIVNGTEEVNAGYAALNTVSGRCKALTSEVKDGIDPEILKAEHKNFTGNMVRMQVGPDDPADRSQTHFSLMEMPKYAKSSFEKKVLATSTGAQAQYIEVIPTEVRSADKGSVPLVILAHGAGEVAEDALYQYGWADLAESEKFMVVAIDQHAGQTATDVADIIKTTLSAYPFLDSSRVYMTGFSMGGMKTSQVIEQYPELLAAAAPMHGTTAPSEDTVKTGYKIPTMLIVGRNDGLVRFPSSTFTAFIDHVFKVNGVSDTGYDYENGPDEDNYWHVEPDKTEALATNDGTAVRTFSGYESVDGRYYTVLVDCTKTGHVPVAENAPIIWNWMKQFSRGENGLIGVEKTFSDVSGDAWYSEAVEFAAKYGVMSGTGENIFSPAAAVSRAAAVTSFWNYIGNPSTEAAAFKDVDTGSTYAKAIGWAAANGVVNGAGGSNFYPDSEATREDTVVMLYRLCEKLGVDMTASADLSAFKDAGAVSSYAKTAMEWAVGSGIISGASSYGTPLLAPKDTITKAEIAKIIYQLDKLVTGK